MFFEQYFLLISLILFLDLGKLLFMQVPVAAGDVLEPVLMESFDGWFQVPYLFE